MVAEKEFIELKIAIPSIIEDDLSNYLIDIGSTGCIVRERELTAYFPVNIWSDAILTQITSYMNGLATALDFRAPMTIALDRVIDRDWNAEWKKSLSAFEVCPGVIIKPSWVEMGEVSRDNIVVEIDPQMAFGSGMHATTKLIMKLMHKRWQNRDTVLDIGTGSGILTILASKLGCGRVIAFDNDPVAVFTAKENIARNHVNSDVQLFVGTINSIRNLRADLILVNINRHIILDISKQIIDLLKMNEYIILSGVLYSEREIVKQRFIESNFTCIDEECMNEWIALVLRKNG